MPSIDPIDSANAAAAVYPSIERSMRRRCNMLNLRLELFEGLL
jgi:hypothetical protein